ncbi:hypothetical protein [Trichlorobacter lovleyi]|nr:hypothetical protein [Trichlorobacter lovleyi]
MYSQLKEVGANVNDFKKIPARGFSTIRFKPSSLQLLDEPKRFSHEDPAVRSSYYNLVNKIKNPDFKSSEFVFTSGHNEGKESTNRSYSESNNKSDLFHNRMQTNIYNQFCLKYGKDKVGTELDTGYGTKIDLSVKLAENNYIFYEIKTLNSVKACIREALSQLLEYSYFPNKKIASKLIIISHNNIDNDNEQYIKILRRNFNIPIYYQKYSIESNRLDERIY